MRRVGPPVPLRVAPLKKTLHLAVKFRHRGVERLAPRIEYDGPLRAQLIQMQAHCLSQAPLDTIAHDGFAERARDGKSDTWADGFGLANTKGSEQGVSVPGTLIVNSSEVLRTQQTDTFRKTSDRVLPLGTDREFLAAARAAAGQNGATVLRLHPGAKPVRLRAMAVIWLESAFRHDDYK